LTDLVGLLIDAAEKNRVADYLQKCNEAGLTEKLVKKIGEDARFPESAKILLKNSIPRLIAKWMNKTGISGEYQDEVAVMTAVILIVKHNAGVDANFQEILAELKKQKTAPAPAPAAPAQPVAPAGPAPIVAPLKIPTDSATVELKL